MLYNGVRDPKGNLVRYSLEDSAKKIGFKKKSLDDYLLQLRKGQRHGFDFLKHRYDMVGCLRSFVKEMEKGMKEKDAPKGKVAAKRSTRGK